MQSRKEKVKGKQSRLLGAVVGMMTVMLTCPFNIFSEIKPHYNPATVAVAVSASAQSLSAVGDSLGEIPAAPKRPSRPVKPGRRHSSPISNLPDSFPVAERIDGPAMVVLDSVALSGDSLNIVPVDSAEILNTFTFNPNPTKAVWMSALFPGLGQLYNRRYWKLPIVVGAYMGLGYATNWNNTMLRDYTRAYSDIMDNDPSTKSYMDFFAPTVKEEDLDKRWLTDILRRRKNYYRRNRDLCIICMIGVYALAMVDAYVDASLSHFDITPDLSMDISPTLMPNETRTSGPPSVGLYWALNF